MVRDTEPSVAGLGIKIKGAGAPGYNLTAMEVEPESHRLYLDVVVPSTNRNYEGRRSLRSCQLIRPPLL